MKRTHSALIGITALILCVIGISSCDRTHLQIPPLQTAVIETELDKEIRRVMEKGVNLEERKSQIPAIEKAFSRRTDPERARKLAALCYFKTLGTPFSPLDMAEIALVETGGHYLSAMAVSEMGAMGVWQLMPDRAMSHGYSPDDMLNDEKCAEAAVKELAGKLALAGGNLVRAKKYYCGIGPSADVYEFKRRRIRNEIISEMKKANSKQVELRYKIERPT